MCQIEGSNIDVRFDRMANVIIIDLDGESAVPAEEVIRCLGSDRVAARTRKRLRDIAQRGSEVGTQLILHLQGVWEAWIEFDIRDALKNLLAERRLVCA